MCVGMDSSMNVCVYICMHVCACLFLCDGVYVNVYIKYLCICKINIIHKLMFHKKLRINCELLIYHGSENINFSVLK